MSPNQEHRLEVVFNAARELPPLERISFLERACAGDTELRRQADSLLAAHEQAGQFLQRTVTESISNAPVEKPGERIDRYKLLEQIGEGGFGVVWMAEQEAPVRRRVALKIIKLGMDTREVVARFEAERQALAMMDHPNISRVFDGGATDTGRPYFVMELVKGIPITKFCDERKLSTRERLELFMQVCQAVQHAHQKGVIHRDLKPSNVLVTVQDDRPVPKVIDFGVAKATQARLTEKTLFTRFNQWIGTPAYMSPEQAGLGSTDVDTRSDIYSLGVLLYELLTGRTPFDTKKLLEAGFDAVMRTIREDDPPKPSTRLSTLAEEELSMVAAKRDAEPAKLNSLVRGDLDWIVMKALEKDRQRRYETANAFAGDIGCYLNNEPVSAVAASGVYRFRKLVRRHRGAFAAGAGVAAALVLGLAASLWLYALERRASHRATSAEQATQTALAGVRTERDRAVKAEAATREQRDHAAKLLSLSQAERGVRLLERDDPSGLLHLVEARKTVDHLPDDRAARNLLWNGWIDSWPATERRVLHGTAEARALTFSPDSRWLAAGCTSRGFTVYDVANKREFAFGSTGQVWSAELSVGGRFLVLHAGAVKELWELVPGAAEPQPRKLMSVPLVDGVPGDITMSPGGEWIIGGPASGSDATTPGSRCEFTLWNARRAQSRSIPFIQPQYVVDATSGQWRVSGSTTPVPAGKMALSADGKLLAGLLGGALQVWDLPSGLVREKPLREARPGLSGFTERLILSPDGRRLWEQRTGESQLYDVTTSQAVGGAIPSTGALSPVMSRDGRWMGVANAGSLQVFDAQTGERIGEPLRHEANVRIDAVAFSPDGNRMITGGRDGVIRLWEVATGRLVEQVHKHPSGIAALTFSDDGQWLAASTQDATVHLHRLAIKERAPIWEAADIQFLGIHRDKLLMYSMANATIQSFDLLTGRAIAPQWTRFDGQSAPRGPGAAIRMVVSTALSSDGQTLATLAPMVGRQDWIQLWDTATGRASERSIAATNEFQLEFSQDGKMLAGLAGDGSIQLWDVATRQAKARLTLPNPWEVTWMGLRFSPDAGYIATRSGFQLLHVWNVKEGRLIDASLENPWFAISFDWQSAFGTAGLVDFRDPRRPGPRHPITADKFIGLVEFSRDGRLLAVAMGDNSLQLWDSATGRRWGLPMKTAARVTRMEFSPDGRLLVTAESGPGEAEAGRLARGAVRLWDTATGLPCGRPIATAFGSIFTDFHLSPDNRFLCLPTHKLVPGASDHPTPVVQVWRLPASDMPLVDMQRRTSVVTGMRLDAVGNVVAADTAMSEGN